MTGREPLRLVPPVTRVRDGAADVLQTATDAHRELDRIERERRNQTEMDLHWLTVALTKLTAKSRPGKAKLHNIIGTAVGVVLLIVCLVIIILAAAGIPIAKADTLDELAATVCHAIAAGGGTADTVLTIIGRGVAVGLTEQEAVDAIDLAVIVGNPGPRP